MLLLVLIKKTAVIFPHGLMFAALKIGKIFKMQWRVSMRTPPQKIYLVPKD